VIAWLRQSIALGLVWLLVAVPVQAPAQEKQVRSHCQVAMESLFGDGSDYFDDFVFPHVPQESASVADTHLPNAVSTFVVAPMSSEQYRNIFRSSGEGDSQNTELTQSQVSELNTVQASLKKILGRISSDDLNDKSFAARIKADPAAFVLLVGHNDKGRFRFADGSDTTIDLIAQAARPDQRVIFISCQASEHLSGPNAAGTSRELTYPEAFEIAKSIQTYIKGVPDGLSLQAVKRQLEDTEANIGFKYKVKYFLMKAACAGGTVIVVALLISLADPCLHKEKC